MRGAAAIILLLAVSSISAAGDVPARKLTFAPHWLPQAQFAGYYVALEKGMYRERDLDVTLLQGGPGESPARLLLDGRADVASLWLTTAIQQRDRGLGLVNVAQLLERSSLMLVAKKSSGIRLPTDLRGRKVGVWGGDFMLQPLEFFRRYRVDVELVPLGSTINLFLRDGVDVTVAMWFNEYHTILNAGLEPNELTTFFFAESGLNFPEDGIYCREGDLQTDPSACRDFVQASLQGWSYAFAHPDEAVDLVLQQMLRAHLGTNAAHQHWMLARMQDLMLPQGDSIPMGALRRDDFDRAAAALRDSGSIRSAPKFQDFHHSLVAAP